MLYEVVLVVLNPYRVLDLTNERGLLGGRMLGDLGASVIQVEPPGGSSARRVGPFIDGEEDASERSAYWAAYAANKRGITLNLDEPEGQALLRRLAERADFFFESADPGVMKRRGLSYADLAAVNPALIYISITPFGQDGPKAGYADSDLVLWASSVALGQSREPGRPPVRISAVWQSYLHAGADGAGGALVAHFERVRSGEGQHVDVSIQQSSAQATLSIILGAAVGQPEQPLASAPGAKWRVKDGYVDLTLGMGGFGHFVNNFFAWMHEQGGRSDGQTLDWTKLTLAEFPAERLERIRAEVAQFLLTKTKQEILEAAISRKFMASPVLNSADLAASRQLAARGYWRAIPGDPHPDRRYPGAPAQTTQLGFRYTRPAPHVGQHNREVYVEELGLSDAEFERLAAQGVI